MFTFFKRYYYANDDKEKKQIFKEFLNVIKNSSYEDYYTQKKSILDLIYKYDYITKCNFSEEEFKFALPSCLYKAFEKYIPPEEYENGNYQDTMHSSLGLSNEDALILYLGKRLFWYLVEWKRKYNTGNYIICKECGKLIKKEKNIRNRKYCISCSEEVKKEQVKKAKKKYYNSYKFKN